MARPATSRIASAADVASRFAAALAAHRRGKLGEAIVGYRGLLAMEPNHVDALANLGTALHALGKAEEAVPNYREAIALRPDLTELKVNLGGALKSIGALDEAREILERAIAAQPGSASAHINLGNVLRATGDYDGALAAYERAAVLSPEWEAAYSNQGLALKSLGRSEEAIDRFRRAIACNPGAAEVHYNLGNTLREIGDYSGAVHWLEKSIALDPAHKRAQMNLGVALKDTGRLAEAFAAFERAIALDHDYADAHWNRALAWLLSGDYGRGWPAYEWRWRATDMHQRAFSQPLWDGAPLAGRTILLHAEQGLGDTIQFIRYVPLAAERGGRIVVECHAPLARLLATCSGVDHVVTRGEELPAFDLHAPLMSLPAIFGTRLASVPAEVPYLAAPAAATQELSSALQAANGLRKIGIVWAGNPAHDDDRNRSMDPASFAPLAARSDVAVFSLQKGDAANEISCIPCARDLGAHLADFADTAWAVTRLDLVITVDTALAHVAGGLGRPVWLLLPFAPEWRWLRDRTDSPWYPTMRIFRQDRPGDWPGVMHKVAAALDAHSFQD